MDYSSQTDMTVDPTVLVSFNCQHSRITHKGISVKDCLKQVPLDVFIGDYLGYLN